MCQLIATERSYVMKIRRAEVDAMLAQGFAFGQRLDAGRHYYQSLFAVHAEAALQTNEPPKPSASAGEMPSAPRHQSVATWPLGT